MFDREKKVLTIKITDGCSSCLKCLTAPVCMGVGYRFKMNRIKIADEVPSKKS